MKENKKLISARIDPETLKKIDAFRDKQIYWTRNHIIDKILYAVFEDFDEKDIYDMVRRPHWALYKIMAKYEILNQNETHKETTDGKDNGLY